MEERGEAEVLGWVLGISLGGAEETRTEQRES